MKKYADIHTHSTLKPITFKSANEKDKKGSLWYQDLPKKRQRDNDFVKYTESDFTTLAQGKVKIVFTSLYPLEQGWFASKSTGILVDFLAHIVTDFPIKRINQIQSEHYNYFQELQREHKFLLDEIELPRTIEIEGKKEIIWAKSPIDKTELNKFIDEENTIIVIPTIEGANSLISGNSKNIGQFDLNQTLKNIDTIKKWSTPPFFLTMSHHFFNGMTGHSRSIFGKNKLEDIVEQILLNQAEGIESNITEKGWKVIKSLLAVEEFSNNGKRILIDTKHLNARSRKEYYKYIQSYNSKNIDDNIPIINSHCAYNNKPTISKTMATDALENKVFTETEFFNEAEINITDEDVEAIFNSNGLIGINLDERILSSKKVIDTAESEFNFKPTDKLRIYWADQIVRNIIAMAKVVLTSNSIKNKQNVWNIFAIGSDFDGFINPVDGFITANEFKELDHFLIMAFGKNEFFKQNSNNLSAQKITDKILFENTYNFLKANYWKCKNDT